VVEWVPLRNMIRSWSMSGMGMISRVWGRVGAHARWPFKRQNGSARAGHNAGRLGEGASIRQGVRDPIASGVGHRCHRAELCVQMPVDRASGAANSITSLGWRSFYSDEWGE